MSELLRGLPAIGALLEHPVIKPLRGSLDPALVADVLRAEVAAERARRLAGEAGQDVHALAVSARAELEGLGKPRLKPVINATGVVINTNLGRAPLGAQALEQLMAVARGYSNLEIDLASGQRGSRHTHVEGLLTRLTGAEAAIVVNNCAAAVLLVADTFARGREVVVSRGQLIEIGGSFRLPEVLAGSGAKLVEVGTTNKTYLADYERALRPETSLLLLSHTSNYRIVGFTAEVERQALAALGQRAGVVTVEDLGSGLLVDLTRYGLPKEPTVQESLAAGLDLVLVSGDKLLGGPQAGLVLGRRELVARLKRNPLMRALRPDKLALAALEGSLRPYLDPGALDVPIMKMMARTSQELEAMARKMAAGIAGARVVAGKSAVGGGTLPGVELPTWLVAVKPRQGSVDELARRLRTGERPLVGRIADDALLLDPRTLLEGEAELVAELIEGALS